MTAKQMVRHLICSYEVALGERAVEPMERPVAGAGEVDCAAVGSALAEESSDDAGVETGNRGASRRLSLTCWCVRWWRAWRRWRAGRSYAPAHPMFGPMTPEDWMRWGYLHADHHLRQFGR